MTTPVVVLTGFLGSGKTTLLNRLLRHPGLRDTAVVMNEFGAIGIDHDLVVGSRDNTVLLDSGCLCCQPRDGLPAAIDAFLKFRPIPQRIVIETSGLANPLPILEMLAVHPDLARRVEIRCVVALVDARFGGETIEAHEEARLQIAAADRLVVTKTAGAAAGQLAALLRKINRTAVCHFAEDEEAVDSLASAFSRSSWDDAAISGGDPAAAGPHQHGLAPAHRHDSAFETAAIRFSGELEPAFVQAWIDDVLESYGAYILRIKGLIRLAGSERLAVLQCVRDVVQPLSFVEAGSDDLRESRIVIIAEGVHPDFLKELLDRLAAKARDLAA